MTGKQMRQQLINYIKKNDSFYFDKNFESHSLTELVILKTEIELRIEKQKDRERNEKLLIDVQRINYYADTIPL